MERKAGIWTVDKLDFLEKYIPAFVKATRKALNRYYVDGFAGPGLNKIESGETRRGSPLIALDQDDFEKLWFVEKNRKNYRSLKARVERHRNAEKAELLQGDFNELLLDILVDIPSRAPTFFLLDPEGLELKWSSVEAISKREKADLFILVSASGVLRNAPKPTTHETLTAFYGGEEWKQVERYKKPGFDYFEAYLDIYLEKIRSLGFRHVDRFIIARNTKRAKMYALVFAAKHPVGIKIASDILEDLTNPARKMGMDPLF